MLSKYPTPGALPVNRKAAEDMPVVLLHYFFFLVSTQVLEIPEHVISEILNNKPHYKYEYVLLKILLF